MLESALTSASNNRVSWPETALFLAALVPVVAGIYYVRYRLIFRVPGRRRADDLSLWVGSGWVDDVWFRHTNLDLTMPPQPGPQRSLIKFTPAAIRLEPVDENNSWTGLTIPLEPIQKVAVRKRGLLHRKSTLAIEINTTLIELQLDADARSVTHGLEESPLAAKVVTLVELESHIRAHDSEFRYPFMSGPASGS